MYICVEPERMPPPAHVPAPEENHCKMLAKLPLPQFCMYICSDINPGVLGKAWGGLGEAWVGTGSELGRNWVGTWVGTLDRNWVGTLGRNWVGTASQLSRNWVGALGQNWVGTG